jgi:flavin reductase (DIM6/NTAB) family NADH-FMN oxidoreductase RutF
MTQVFNQRAFRNTLGRFATGVTIITVLEGGRRVA